jgi:hypothetical protein
MLMRLIIMIGATLLRQLMYKSPKVGKVSGGRKDCFTFPTFSLPGYLSNLANFSVTSSSPDSSDFTIVQFLSSFKLMK